MLRLDRLADLAVRAHPARGRQLFEQRRAHERVPEAVAVEADLVHQPRGTGRVEQVDDRVLVGPEHRREHGHCELVADDRRGREPPLRGLVEA